MTAPSLDILVPIRQALIATTAVTAKLGMYLDQPAVFTRSPAPPAAKLPMIVVGLVSRTDNDGISDYRPSVMVDVNAYGEEQAHYRDVEAVSDVIYRLFHRQKRAIAVTHYTVTSIRCAGPFVAPVAIETNVGRRVSMVIDLYAK